MNSITLNKCKFFAYHGVDEQERKVGNHFEVTLKVFCDMNRAMTDEALDGTINYAVLYEILAREMAKPSLLLEHVAHRVILAVKQEFVGQVLGGEITISKLTPPFTCDLESVDVTIGF